MSLPSCRLFFIANVALFGSKHLFRLFYDPPNDTPHSHVLQSQAKIKKTSSKFFEFAVLAGHSCFSRTNLIQGEVSIGGLAKFCRRGMNGILLTKLFWRTLRKKMFWRSDNFERTFSILKFSQKTNKWIRFYYYDKFVLSFFGRIQGYQKVLLKLSNL